MSRIEKKIWPQNFDTVSNGKKKYELRLADFDVKEGDTLVLREWNPESKGYTGRVTEKKVSFVNIFRPTDLTKFWSKEDMDEYGVQVISLE